MHAVLAALPRTRNGLVFPSEATGGAITGWSQRMQRLVAASGIPSHARLTQDCRTLMSRLGVAEAVAEAAIGHVRDNLTTTYDKYDHWAERIEAFSRVSGHVARGVAETAP